ncbi:hypothetical protein CCP3SC15_4500001 [Gammaproteobacteria bacterium]
MQTVRNNENDPLTPTAPTTLSDMTVALVKLQETERTLRAEIANYQRTEAILQENEERYRAVIETALDGFWMVDKEGRLLEVNDAYQRQSGYSREELLNLRVSDLEVLEKPEDTRDHIGQVLRTGSDRFETVHRRKDGSVWPVEIIVSYWSPDSGRLLAFLRDITARKQVEQKLRVEEERFRLIAETITELFWIADPQIQRMFYISPAYEEIWKRSCASLYENPSSFMEGIHPEDRTRVINNLRSNHPFGRSFTHEYRVVRPDGSIRWVWDRGFPVADNEGNAKFYIGIVQDITERKEAELALRNTRNLLGAIVEGTSDAVFAKDREGRYLLFNSAAARMTDRSATEVIGHDDFSLFPPAVAERVRAHDQAVMASGKNLSYEENLFRSTDGRKVPVWVIKGPLQIEGEMSGIFGISRDITERKNLLDRLQESEALFRAIFHSAGSGIELIDADTLRFVDVNEASCRLLGYTHEEFLHMRLLDIQVNIQEELFIQAVREITTLGCTTFENQHRCKNGKILDVEVTASTLNLGSRHLIVGVWQDITARKHAEERQRLAASVFSNSQEGVENRWEERIF